MNSPEDTIIMTMNHSNLCRQLTCAPGCMAVGGRLTPGPMGRGPGWPPAGGTADWPVMGRAFTAARVAPCEGPLWRICVGGRLWNPAAC